MPGRRSKRTGRFKKSTPNRTFTMKEKKSYRAGFKAGYDQALLDMHRKRYPLR